MQMSSVAKSRIGFPLLFGGLFTTALFASDAGWILYIPVMTLLAALVGRNLWGRERQAPQPTAPALSALYIVGSLLLLGLFASPAPFLSLFELQTYLLLAGGLWVFSVLEPTVARRALVCCVPAFAYLMLAGAKQGFFEGLLSRAHFDDSNLYAGLLLSALAVGAGLLYDYRDRIHSRYLLGALTGSLILGVAVMFAARSRGAQFSLVGALAITLWMLRVRLGLAGKHARALVLVTLLLAIAGSVAKTHSDLAQHQGLGASTNSRIAMWQSTLRMVADHPFTGVGLGLWHVAYPRYRTAGDSDSAGYRAHNDYLEALATTGPFGFLAALSIPGLWLLSLRRAREGLPQTKGFYLGLAIGVGALCLQGLVNFIVHQSAVSLWLGALLGSMFSLQKPSTARGALLRPKPVWHTSLVLGAFVLSSLGYFSLVPELIVGNADSFEAQHLKWVMRDQVLQAIAGANPLASGAYFALGHQAHLAGMSATTVAGAQAEYKKALFYYGLAERREPIQESLLVRMALVVEAYPGLSSDKRIALAEHAYRKSLEANPAFLGAIKPYARQLVRLHREPEARALIERAMQSCSVYQQRNFRALLDQIASGRLARP